MNIANLPMCKDHAQRPDNKDWIPVTPLTYEPPVNADESNGTTPHPPPSVQLIQMLQPCQHHLLTRLLNLAREKDLVKDRIDLVKVKDQIQLAHVSKERVEHFDKEVQHLEVCQLIIIRVDAGAEKEPRVPSVHNLVIPVLDKVGLVLLVPRRNQSVHLAFDLDLLVVGVRHVPFRETGLASGRASELVS